MFEKIKQTDEKLSESVVKIHTPWLNKVMLFMTFLGDQGKVWFLAMAIIILLKRSVYVGTSLFLSLAVSFLSAEVVIKRMVGRVRPCHKIDEENLILRKMPKFYSFPSSHSATSFAMATVSFMLLGAGYTVVLMIIAVGISFSRFYLQAHYLTDVLCGIIFGILSAVIVVKLLYALLNSIDPSLTII